MGDVPLTGSVVLSRVAPGCTHRIGFPYDAAGQGLIAILSGRAVHPLAGAAGNEYSAGRGATPWRRPGRSAHRRSPPSRCQSPAPVRLHPRKRIVSWIASPLSTLAARRVDVDVNRLRVGREREAPGHVARHHVVDCAEYQHLALPQQPASSSFIGDVRALFSPGSCSSGPGGTGTSGTSGSPARAEYRGAHQVLACRRAASWGRGHRRGGLVRF